MPRISKRVTSFFTGKVPNDDDPNKEEHEPAEHEHGEEEPMSSTLLIGTSDCSNLPALLQGPKPKKSILKSTSTLSSKSGISAAPYYTTSSSSMQSRDSRISFSQIRVRTYPVLIGDNPSVGQGVPLTIGWEHSGPEERYPVEEFERHRKAEPVSSLQEMKFTPEQRTEIAKNLGYSERKIDRIAHQVKFSTLTRKKKIIRTLHLDTMKTSFRKGLAKLSNSSRNLLGNEHDNEECEGDDRDALAF